MAASLEGLAGTGVSAFPESLLTKSVRKSQLVYGRSCYSVKQKMVLIIPSEFRRQAFIKS